MLECIITSVFARLSLIFMQSCNTNASTMGINIDRTYIQAWTCIWFPNEMFVKNNVAKKELREMLLASGNSLTRGQGLGGGGTMWYLVKQRGWGRRTQIATLA